jgi:hypothetical protein
MIRIDGGTAVRDTRLGREHQWTASRSIPSDRCCQHRRGARHGAGTFIYHYVIQRWSRFGERGLLLAAVAGFTKFTNYAKPWERRHIEAGQGIWTEAEHRLLERYQVEDRD